MKNRLKRGFTLVELLVTIVLLGIVGAIIIYNMTSVTSDSKESEYERFIATVKSAAQIYADSNPDAFASLYTNKAFIYFTVSDLIQNGYLDEELVNPYTEERINGEERIKANLDTVEGSLAFEYPLTGDVEEESFLVALSDYVQNGEPYDCMQGVGTYQLALSKENGDLIDLSDPNTIEEYSFECSMPKDIFELKTMQFGSKSVTGWVTKEEGVSGSYDVTYTWTSESGTRKSAKRVLRVLPKLEPTLSFTTAEDIDGTHTPYAYDVRAEIPPVYEPTYNTATGKFAGLFITPEIEGGALATSYKVYRVSIDPTENSIDRNNSAHLVVDTVKDPSKAFKPLRVDDGVNKYLIVTTVNGHHVKEYSYEAEGEYIIHQELLIPSSLIEGTSIDWTLDKIFTITDTYSPVGVAKYEYYVSKESAPNNLNSFGVEETHTFTRVQNKTSKLISAIEDSCTNALNEYQYVFFRAINKNGYVGKWTAVQNAYITNHLAKIVTTESKTSTSCELACTKSGYNCYYCEKQRYVNFGNRRFVLLEKFGSGSENNQILAAYDGLSNAKVTPTSIRRGSYTVRTCDGSYTVNYTYSVASTTAIEGELATFARTLPNNYENFLVSKAWGGMSYGYLGTVTSSLLNRYGNALHESDVYWTTDRLSGTLVVHVNRPYNHGDYSTRHSTYLYAVYNGQLTQAYAGGSAYVKPLVQFKPNIYVCAGNGSKSNPYKVATN